MVHDFSYDQVTLVMATKGTIESEKFHKLYNKYDNHKTYLMACHGLADIIEEGNEDKIKQTKIKEYEYTLPSKNLNKNYFIDFGVGCTFYFGYFRFSPELKFALGFNDMLIPWSERPNDVLLPADRKYSDALSRLTSRMLTICLNFE